MKRAWTILLMVICAMVWSPGSGIQAQDSTSQRRSSALTKEDVINLSTIRVADDVIISAIQSSGAVFDLTPQDLIELTRSGVSPAVIEAMQKTKQPKPTPTPAPARNADPEEEVPEDEEPTPEVVKPTPRPTEAPRRVEPSEPDRGGGLSAQQVKPLPADVRQLKRRYETGKYISAAAMAFDLLTGPNKDRYTENRSTIYFYLGKSLFKLGFYHSAHDIFLTVAKDGPNGPHFNNCLGMLTRTSEILKEYQGFSKVLQGVTTKDLPRRVRSTLLYLIGLSHYDNEDFDEARRALEGVSQSSEFYSQAQFIEAMAMYRQSDSRQAVRTFRALVEAQVVGNAEEIRDIKDLSLLNMARVYYRVEDFKRARQLYELVPRDSRYWPQSLYEAAYANFFLGDYNISLGQLLTLRSPFILGHYYLPEADILEALVYFNLCEYNRVEKIIRDFKTMRKPLRETLSRFLKEHDQVLKGNWDTFHNTPEAMKQAIAAYMDLFESPRGRKLSGIPADILAEVENQRNFKNLHYHLAMLRQEMDQIKSGKAKWNDTRLGNTLMQKLQQDESLLRADAGRYLLEQLARIEKEHSNLLGQAEIIQFEVVSAQKEEFEDKFRNPENVETYEKLEQSYATESTFIYWPFTDEFWEDELGYYRFTERGSCGTKRK